MAGERGAPGESEERRADVGQLNPRRLLRPSGYPIARPRANFQLRPIYDHLDLVKSAFGLVVGGIAQQVLAVQFVADPRYRLLQASLPDEGVFPAAREARENVQGIVYENALRRFENVDEDRNVVAHVVILIDSGWRGGAAARIVLRLGRDGR